MRKINTIKNIMQNQNSNLSTRPLDNGGNISPGCDANLK